MTFTRLSDTFECVQLDNRQREREQTSGILCAMHTVHCKKNKAKSSNSKALDFPTFFL